MSTGHKPDKGDMIICNDVVGVVTGCSSTSYKITTKEGSIVELTKSANIQIIANSFSIAALVYQKLLKARKGA